MSQALRYWEDLAEGAVYETAGRTMTEADLGLYSGLSGDWNEVHTNEPFAAEHTPFGTRIAHGPLGITFAFGLMSRLGLWEGTGLAVLGLEWSFHKAVPLGDTLRVRMTVLSKRPTSKPDRGVLVRGVEVLNQRDEVAQSGTITILIKRRPDDAPAREDEEK